MRQINIVEQLIADEGLRLKPYKCTSGKTTIGVGRNLDDKGISKDEAIALLTNDIKECMDELDKRIPWWINLTHNRRVVLINMCFNLGISGLMKFKNTLNHIRNHDYAKASVSMLDSKWAKQVKNRAVRLAIIMREGE